MYIRTFANIVIANIFHAKYPVLYLTIQIDWKYPSQLAGCNPRLIPALRPACPTPDTLILTSQHLTIRPFVTEHAGANLTDPAQPWPPTPPALGLAHRRPGHTTFPGRDKEPRLIVSSNASPLPQQVRSSDLPHVPAAGMRGKSMQQR